MKITRGDLIQGARIIDYRGAKDGVFLLGMRQWPENLWYATWWMPDENTSMAYHYFEAAELDKAVRDLARRGQAAQTPRKNDE